MYNVSRNNFYDDPKNSTVFTPSGVSQFIFDIIAEKLTKPDQFLTHVLVKGHYCIRLTMPVFKRPGWILLIMDIKTQSCIIS